MFSYLRVLFFFFLMFHISHAYSFPGLDYEKKMYLINQTFIKDLAIGEKMRISGWDICKKNGRYVVPYNTTMASESKYAVEVMVTRLPQNQVSIKMSPPAYASYDKDIGSMILRDVECEKDIGIIPNYFSIKDINGFMNESDYISELLKQGYKTIID